MKLYTKPLGSMEAYVENQRKYNEVRDNSPFVELAKRNLRSYLGVLREWGLMPASLLDAGCREGYILAEAEEVLGGILDRAVGVDIVPEFVKTCTDVFGYESQVADIHELPFEDAEFESVYCSQTLEHSYDVPIAVVELFRVAARAVFIGVPVEDNKSFVENPSHYARCASSLDWIAQIQPPRGWELIHAFRNKETSYINMTFLKGL